MIIESHEGSCYRVSERSEASSVTRVAYARVRALGVFLYEYFSMSIFRGVLLLSLS